MILARGGHETKGKLEACRLFSRPKQVLHSAVHPHVLKIVETFASADALLDHFHRHYADFLEGIFDFRAAVNPTVQAYTPLAASVRPSLSAR